MAEKSAVTDWTPPLDKVGRLINEGDRVSARRELSLVGVGLEAALRANQFDRTDWERLAKYRTQLEEYCGAAEALKVIEVRCGRDPLLFLQAIKVRSNVDNKDELEQELWDSLHHLPRTPEILRAAVGAYGTVGTRVHYYRSLSGRDKRWELRRWNRRLSQLEDQLIDAAPDDFHAVADAASRARHRIKECTMRLSAWAARWRAVSLGKRAHSILLRRREKNPLAWLYISEIEEGLGLLERSVESGITGFRQAPENVQCLRWIAKRYNSVRNSLTKGELDAAFKTALTLAENRADDLAVFAELLVDCDRQGLASEVLERCFLLDPGNVRALAAQRSIELLQIAIARLTGA